TIGPTAVLGSAGSPTGKAGMASTIARLTASSRLFGTRSRVPAAQACPLFIKARTRADGIERSGVHSRRARQNERPLPRSEIHILDLQGGLFRALWLGQWGHSLPSAPRCGS